MGSHAKDLVVIVKGSRPVSHVGADGGVENIDVLHGVIGTLYVVDAKVRHSHDHDPSLEKREESRPGGAKTNAKTLDVRVGILQYWVGGAGCDVANLLAMRVCQFSDKGLEITP